MKKFKSLSIFVLVFIMLSGMAACGGDKNSTDQTGKQQSSTKGQTTNGQTTGKSNAASTTPGTTAAGTTAASTTKDTTTGGGTAGEGTAPGAAANNTTSASDDVYPENGLSKTQQVTLKMGFFEGGVGRAFMDYAVQTFTQRFPNVSIEITASPTIENIIMPKISAGDDEDMFDIFSTTRLQWDELADAGKIVPMTDLWERSPYDTPGASLKDLFISTSYKYNRFKRMGNTYAIDYGLM
jgi:N-acetylglucosamine transport system substrate-binding protein